MLAIRPSRRIRMGTSASSSMPGCSTGHPHAHAVQWNHRRMAHPRLGGGPGLVAPTNAPSRGFGARAPASLACPTQCQHRSMPRQPHVYRATNGGGVASPVYFNWPKKNEHATQENFAMGFSLYLISSGGERRSKRSGPSGRKTHFQKVDPGLLYESRSRSTT